MINKEEILRIYKLLSANGIQVWLVGGWGIDALLGEQTRPHKDLDILLLLDDVAKMGELLGRCGYALKALWEENRWVTDRRGNKTATAFVLQNPDGYEIDVHALRFDDQRQGIPAWEAEAGFLFKPEDLAGQGEIGGLVVQCISPEMQMRVHTGYTLPEYQVQDLALLDMKFGSRPAAKPANPNLAGA